MGQSSADDDELVGRNSFECTPRMKLALSREYNITYSRITHMELSAALCIYIESLHFDEPHERKALTPAAVYRYVYKTVPSKNKAAGL